MILRPMTAQDADNHRETHGEYDVDSVASSPVLILVAPSPVPNSVASSPYPTSVGSSVGPADDGCVEEGDAFVEGDVYEDEGGGYEDDYRDFGKGQEEYDDDD